MTRLIINYDYDDDDDDGDAAIFGATVRNHVSHTLGRAAPND